MMEGRKLINGVSDEKMKRLIQVFLTMLIFILTVNIGCQQR